MTFSHEGVDPDEMVVEIEGETVEAYDLGTNWWLADFSLSETAATHFQPGRFTVNGHKLKYTGERDKADVIATDYSYTIDCAAEVPEGSSRTCENYVSRELAAWRDEGTFDVHVTLRKEIEGEMKDICDTTLPVVVERNRTDPNLQPLDFAGNISPTYTEVHGSWHQTRDSAALFPGDDWLLFHRTLIRSYDDYRAFFGYPRVAPWNGSSPIPVSEGGYTMADPSRPPSPPLRCEYPASYPESLQGCTPPPWFTPAGDGTARTDDLPAGAECRTGFNTLVGIGQTSLADFPDAHALGCVINRTHHAEIHKAISGAMTWVSESVFDPIFWSYHKWASGIGDPQLGDSSPAASASNAGTKARTLPVPPGAWESWEAARAAGPPGISATFPPHDDGTSLARIDGELVVFYEPVTGVKASDLKVNGSPATKVEKDGTWYVFTGFASPGDGANMPANAPPVQVTVTLAAGTIKDADDNPFAGASWTHVIKPDTDQDGVPNDRDNCPSAANLDQKNSDVIMVNGFVAHDTTPEFGNPGDEQGDACDDDDDNDHISDEEEIAAGTDPTNPRDPDRCPEDPKKTDPLECGCGVSEKDRDMDGEPECIPPLLVPESTTTSTTMEPDGICGQPVSTGNKPKASDCLYILQAAVGQHVCHPQCICAVGGTLPVKASDALRCLRVAIGLPQTLNCPC